MNPIPPITTPPTCPNCGEPIDPGIPYCQYCGWRKVDRGASIALQIVLLIFLGLPALAVGGCFFVVGAGGLGGTSDIAFQLVFIGIGLLSVSIFVWTLWALIRSFQRKP